jgi:hypothetical protein
MLVRGEWQLRDDGVIRPIVRARVGGDSPPVPENFLLDSGTDRTVLIAVLVTRLRLSARSAPPGFTLSGIGGTSAFVLVTTVVGFLRDDGEPVRVRSEFASFTDPTATDLSILGRDVLDHFDLVLSRRRNEILLLAPTHQYRIERT